VSPQAPLLVGVLNLTPDSFSDGGEYTSLASALRHAEALLSDGADIIEVGGDSTRPGSSCCGAATEWTRIEAVVRELAPRCRLSVDTHHAEVAERSLDLGATLINDVSAGSDPRMFEVVARYTCPIIVMFSRCAPPHVFQDLAPENIIDSINRYLDNRSHLAEAAGVAPGNIIRDSGLGAFVSSAPADSWTIIDRYDEITAGGGGLMFGSSRKGFLKSADELSPRDRDPASALTGVTAALHRHNKPGPLYIRTHNVALQRQLLGSLTRIIAPQKPIGAKA
jgi:dihydropteroate synthase